MNNKVEGLDACPKCKRAYYSMPQCYQDERTEERVFEGHCWCTRCGAEWTIKLRFEGFTVTNGGSGE